MDLNAVCVFLMCKIRVRNLMFFQRLIFWGFIHSCHLHTYIFGFVGFFLVVDLSHIVEIMLLYFLHSHCLCSVASIIGRLVMTHLLPAKHSGPNEQS